MELVDNPKAKLYKFVIYANELNYMNIKSIRDKTFFDSDNIFDVSLAFKSGNQIYCTTFSVKFIRILFYQVFNFLNAKFDNKYEIEKIKIKQEKITRHVSICCTFNPSKKPKMKLLGALAQIMSRKMGKVKIYPECRGRSDAKDRK